MAPPTPPSPSVSHIPARSAGGTTVIESQRLLQGERTVVIAHNGQAYRLHATRQGKLILTK